MFKKIYNLLKILRKLSISGAVETLDEIKPILEYYSNIKYFALSNVDSAEYLNEYLGYIPKNIVIVPVIAAILAGTFTSIRYVLNLTDTIEENKTALTEINRDIKNLKEKVTGIQTRLSAAEATWEMAENLYRQLADQVREHSYDIKDLNR